MRKRISLILVLIFGMSSIISCVSPYYGTARIEPGWNLSCGAAFHSCMVPVVDASGYSTGIREDICLSYGFNRYLGAHLQAGYGTAMPMALGFLDVLLGLQAALPLGSITPAIRCDVSSYDGFLSLAPMFLVGAGKREFVTISISTHSDFFFQEQHYYPVNVGIGFHPSTELSLFFGADAKTLRIDNYDRFRPIATIGLGYHLPRDTSKKELHFDLSVSEKTQVNWGIPRLHLIKAEITPGWHIHPGVALLGYIDTPLRQFRMGLEVDVEFSYAPNQHVRFYTQANAGSLGLWGGASSITELTPGLQISWPMRSITPSVIVDYTLSEDYGGFSSSLLTSIGSEKKLTVGSRIRWLIDLEEDLFWDCFAGYQVTPQWFIFGGFEVLGLFEENFYPLFEVGVKHTFKEKEKGE